MTRIAVVLVMLGHASVSLAQPAASSGADRLVTLRGRVVTEGDRPAPVRGASIAVAASGRTIDLVHSDGQGRFVAQVPERSAYLLRVAKAGFVTATVSPPSSVRVAAEAPFEIALTRGGVITGRVRGQRGEPLPNVTVRALRVASTSGSTAPGASEATSQTDDFGEYRLSGLAPGTYSVRVSGTAKGMDGAAAPVVFSPSAQGRADLLEALKILDNAPEPADVLVDVASGEAASVVHDGVVAGRAITVFIGKPGTQSAATSALMAPAPVRGGVVSGTVLDDFGEPVEGVSVELRPIRLQSGGGAMSPGLDARRTDDLGRFRLFGIPPGTYYLASQPGLGEGFPAYAPVYYPGRAMLADAAVLSVEDDRELPGMNLTFALSRPTSVRGIVVDATGQPLVGSVVLAASLPAGVVSLPGPDASIAADGTFELLNVAAGDYVVQATGKGSTGGREFGLVHVNVTGPDVGPVVISTSPGSKVAGRVSFEGNDPTSPVRALGLSVSPADPAYTPARSVYEGGFIDTDRRFEFTGLIGPGRFALEGAPSGWWLESVTIDGIDVTDMPVTFGAQDHRDVVAVIATNGGRVDGRVTGPQGPSFLRQSVAVFSIDESRWFYRSRHLRLARVAPDGRFSVSGLPPGEYWIAARETAFEEGAYTSWQHTDFLTGLIPGAQRIRLVDGDRTLVDLRLARPPR